MTDDCPGGCGRPIKPTTDLCWRCRWRLPRQIRRALRLREPHDREVALMCAAAWIAQNPHPGWLG